MSGSRRALVPEGGGLIALFHFTLPSSGYRHHELPPHVLRILAIIGTAAMLWVGGGIMLLGLEEFGATAPGYMVHDLAHQAAELLPALAGALHRLGLMTRGACGHILPR
jgi:predicted DNA repair protein MutK